MGVECLFTGPTQVDEAEQVRVIRDLITRNVSGLAIAPNNPESVASAIVAAQAKGIPVITFDSDAPKSKRTAFVGTNNRGGGELGGKAFRAAMPERRHLCHHHRRPRRRQPQRPHQGLQGAVSATASRRSRARPIPARTTAAAAIQIVQDVLAKNPNLSGFFFSGGWPMFAPEAYTRAVRSRADAIKAGKFVVVVVRRAGPAAAAAEGGHRDRAGRPAPARHGGAIARSRSNALLNKQKVQPVIDTGVDLVDGQERRQSASRVPEQAGLPEHAAIRAPGRPPWQFCSAWSTSPRATPA